MAPKGGGGQGQSVVEGLKSLYTQVASLMIMPDSMQHMQFLTGLQQTVQKYILTNAQQAAGTAMQGGQQAAGHPMPGGPPGAGGGPPGGGAPMGPPQPPGPSGAGNAMPGLPSAGNINPDELKRMLGATGAAA